MSIDYDPELLPKRIRSRIEISDGHWLWTGQINNKGYGLVHWRTGNRAAHRVIYQLLVGPIPDDLQLDHLCRIKHCVRPSCLEPVTPRENQRRSSAAQTHCRRAGHPRTIENTYTNPKTGRKYCRPCAREDDRQAYWKSRPEGATPFLGAVRANHNRWHVARSVTNPDCTLCQGVVL